MMRISPRSVALGSLLVGSLVGCGDPPGPGSDAAAPRDGGGPVDGGGSSLDGGVPIVDSGPRPDAPGTDGGAPIDDGGPTPACGSARPDVSGISGTEGMVIARDGTIYYSQSGGVGRLVPGGDPEDDWVRIPGASTVWGLALDAANEMLYVAVPSSGTIQRIDVGAASPSASVFVADAGAPNGMTIGPDGALYFSDFGGDAVYRAELGGATATPTEVTASSIASANGVAFLADGTLLVASYATGVLHRLTLTDGAETDRDPFASDVGSPDGIAVAADGRLLVTDNGGGRVIRLEADGTGATTVSTGTIGSAASIEFGAGPLDWNDLYVTSRDAMRVIALGVAGADVPWH